MHRYNERLPCYAGVNQGYELAVLMKYLPTHVGVNVLPHISVMPVIAKADTMVTIIPFEESHINPLIEILFRLKRTIGVYPPRHDTALTVPGLRVWLLADTDALNFTALLDGKVVGHVQHTSASDALVEHFETRDALKTGYELGQISKLFADPDKSHRGIGAALVETARSSCWAHAFQPSVAVDDYGHTAMRVYEDAGLTQLGNFYGTHGHTNVFLDMDVRS